MNDSDWLPPYPFPTRGTTPALGVYTILEKLGEGGMGWVYKARHERLGRLVALKVIRPDRLRHSSALARFSREAQLIAKLQHPNIVVVHDADEVDGVHFIAMEFLAGKDLARYVKEAGPLPAAEACDYARQVALGLQHASERNLVHRDIKPSNLMIVRDSNGNRALVKILDFGLARAVGDQAEGVTATRSGDFLGTPEYVAPEQVLSGKSADIRADIFSLGCTLYYLLTASSAFPGETPEQRYACRLSEQSFAVQLPHPAVPMPLEGIVKKMLARDPGKRFQTPAEVAQSLERFCVVYPVTVSSPPVDSPAVSDESQSADTPRLTPPSGIRPAQPSRGKRWPIAWIVAALAIVGLAAAAALHFLPQPPRPQPPRPEPPINGDRASFTNSLDMVLVRVPAGEFVMGSPATEAGRADDEGPQHRVRFSRDFHVGAHEVTQQQYQRLIKVNPSHFSKTGGGSQIVGKQDTSRFPVEMVSWDDAVAFCRKLSDMPEERLARRRYRLPTEAEWEYACRAGTTGPFSGGATLNSNDANVAGDRPYGGVAKGPMRSHTVAVGSFAPNPLKLFDMHGNVWEWCQDVYEPYTPDEQVDPPARNGGRERVLRGGAWGFDAGECRSARRTARDHAARNSFYGFRVLCAID